MVVGSKNLGGSSSGGLRSRGSFPGGSIRMVTQTTMNGNSNPHVGENLAGLAHDVANLAELQIQLLAVDLRDARSQAGPAAVFLGAGAVAALGAVPVLLMGLGYLLVEWAEWSAAAALLTVSLIAIVGGLTVLYLGWKRLMSAAGTLQRSKSELVETLHWLKESLKPNHHEEFSIPRR